MQSYNNHQYAARIQQPKYGTSSQVAEPINQFSTSHNYPNHMSDESYKAKPYGYSESQQPLGTFNKFSEPQITVPKKIVPTVPKMAKVYMSMSPNNSNILDTSISSYRKVGPPPFPNNAFKAPQYSQEYNSKFPEQQHPIKPPPVTIFKIPNAMPPSAASTLTPAFPLQENSNSEIKDSFPPYNGIQQNINSYPLGGESTQMPYKDASYSYKNNAHMIPPMNPLFAKNEPQNTASGFVNYQSENIMPNFNMQHQPISDNFLADTSAPVEFIAPTLSILPSTKTARKSLNMPIGFSIHPLALQSKEIPEINYGKVIRCSQCRTYVNAFVQWDSAGRRWTCNLCFFVNDCPQHYQGPTDETGKRADRFERKELSSGVYELIASADYMIRPPQPPTFLFLIDVTAMSIGSGLLPVVCQGIKKAILSGNIPGKERALIAIMTYDSSIHFYKVNDDKINISVVTSIDDVFVPFPEGAFLNVAENEAALLHLLTELPQMWLRQRVTESCMGSAIKAAYLVMKQWGGRLMVFASTIPIVGELVLNSSRNEASSSKDPQFLLKPLNHSYSNLSKDIIHAQISVDFFICALPFQQTPLSIDLPTLAPLAKLTGGEIYYYPGFNAASFGDKLREEIVHSILRPIAWEAVMRARISRGWKINDWYGHFSLRNGDLMVLPTCHADQSFTLAFDLENDTALDSIVYIQFALLYTNSFGERRIRIATTGLNTSSNVSDCLNSLNEFAFMTLVAQKAIKMAEETNLADARKFIQSTCTTVYKQISKYQESQKIIPYCLLGLIKSTAFQDNRKITADMRCASWARMSTLSLRELKALFIPRLFSLHDMPEDAGLPGPAGETILPNTLALTGGSLSQAGIYLVEDGEIMVIWIGSSADSKLVYDVFGTENLDTMGSINNDQFLGTTGSRLSIRVAAIINAIRSQRKPFMQLHIVKQGSSNEILLFNLLIEDRTQGCNLTLSSILQTGVKQINPAAKSINAASYNAAPVPSHNGVNGAAPFSYKQPPPLNKTNPSTANSQPMPPPSPANIIGPPPVHTAGHYRAENLINAPPGISPPIAEQPLGGPSPLLGQSINRLPIPGQQMPLSSTGINPTGPPNTQVYRSVPEHLKTSYNPLFKKPMAPKMPVTSMPSDKSFPNPSSFTGSSEVSSSLYTPKHYPSPYQPKSYAP